MGILWLGEAACHDATLVGGKAAHLSRLAARYPVPPGFCLPVGSEVAGDERWVGGDGASALLAAYRDLGRRCGVAEARVAVRSSATDEDGQAVSFAGQHETYLNVVGEMALVEAVGRCLASAWTPRALAYRRDHGLDAAPRVAVLVQLLVQADVAAVVFSVDPVTGDRGTVVINATWGLGESLVGGGVTPDLWAIRKEDGAVMSATIADKARMTVAVPGGTAEVATPGFLRVSPSLAPAQLAELSALARELECAMGWPVDLECAYADGMLFLLQCRPVTTGVTRDS
jgi:pyruvate,water dikinase